MQIEAHRPEIPIEEFPIIGFYLYHVTSTGQSSNWTTSGIKQHILTVSLNIFYFQQITSYTVQYIQFIRKLGLERKRKLIEFFSYYRVHCDMEGGLYHINS